MGGREGNAFCREQQTRQQTWMLGAGLAPFAAGVRGELRLDLVPGLSVNDGVMLALVAVALMWDAADIDRIGDNEIEVPAAECCSPTLPAIKQRAQLSSKPSSLTLRFQFSDAAELQVELEEQPDRLGFFGIDAELAVQGIIAERHGAAHPHAFLL